MSDLQTDARNLSKWLNEEQAAPIDRQALARVLAHVVHQEPKVHRIEHAHQWVRTGAMKPGEYRCIACGEWGTDNKLMEQTK